MRPLNALLRVLRTRRDRHPTPEPDATTDRPGLADLLEAARAPGTPDELAGEKEVVAAFVAHRKRAARAARRRTPARIRAALVPATTGLALLILTGTAVAARTGNLPQEAQQHAHRLFSALGVPAPRTGTPTPTGPTPDITNLTWCEAWRGASGRSLSQEDHRKLASAAGPQGIDKYCVDLRRAASETPSPAVPSTSSPRTTPSPIGSPPGSVTPEPSPPPPASATPAGPGSTSSPSTSEKPLPPGQSRAGKPSKPTRPPSASPPGKRKGATKSARPSKAPHSAASSSPAKDRGAPPPTKRHAWK